MIRVLLREAALTALAMFVASVIVFAGIDRALHPDWYGLTGFATVTQLPTRALLAHDLPTLWNPTPLDAAQRTERDIASLRLGGAELDAAQQRLASRGTAAFPLALQRISQLDLPRQRLLLAALARIDAGIPASDPAPSPELDLDAARRYWERYDAAHGLDFRESYASRQASRLLGRDSPNASERIAQLGTYALPALMRALEDARLPAPRARVVNALSDITGLDIRLAPRASEDEARFAVEAWRAWWFAMRSEYSTLAPWQRSLARALDTRYGRWSARALRGRLGVSALTRRSIAVEVRERLPISALTAGIGGLLGVGVAIAFGGAAALRRRTLGARVADLLGAVLPGLVALLFAWVALVRLLNPVDAVSETLSILLQRNGLLRTMVASAACAVPSAFALRRARATSFLDAVRVEAEAWTLRGQSPSLRSATRHAARIAAASLLCPLALAAPTVLGSTLVIETALELRGMGGLTARALAASDGAWLLIAALSVVPILLGRRWSALMLVWILGSRPEGRVRRLRVTAPPPPMRHDLEDDPPGADPPSA